MTIELTEQLDNIVRLLLSEDKTNVELGFALVDAKPWQTLLIERETWDVNGSYMQQPVSDYVALLYIYSWFVRGLIDERMMTTMYNVTSRHFASDTKGQFSIHCETNKPTSIQYRTLKKGRAVECKFAIRHKSMNGYRRYLYVMAYIYRIKGVYYLSFFDVQRNPADDLMYSYKTLLEGDDEAIEYYHIKALLNLSKHLNP